METTRDKLDVLEELRGKYAVMLAMRLEHEAGLEDATQARERMAELASKFPGALREIDDLEIRVIRARIAELEAVLRGERAVEPWMEAIALFHSLARGALCAKRWLAGRKRVTSAIARAYERQMGELAFPGEASAWACDLASIAEPPRGRLMDLVFGRIALELGTSEREARHLIFGAPRKG